MFKWNKKGLIFSPNKHSEWMYSHAQCPFTLDFGDFIRVFFSTREAYKNGMSRAHGGWVDLDKNNLKNILRIAEKPIIELGNIGEFDEFGSMPNSIVKVKEDLYYLYYCGWTRAVSTPYSWEIGFAKGKDSTHFVKEGKGPIIGPTMYEPYLHACPQVYRFSENDWHMFYLSGQKWLQGKEKMESQYLIVHATSNDGINWKRNPNPIINTVVEDESQTSAAIIKIDNLYHMFFCYRYGLDFRKNKGRGYAMGYAYSEDLFNWTRDDSKVGIEVSASGWDSEMIAYPYITKINDKYIMLYCGNNFGYEGFGYAELEIV
ncbi:MAG: hypothetical protein DKM23_03680 [Candidatus Melainabacteria bacterium]|nr:MAG: hypothetical protein DKM23_03680 [Candidatus Melainabacteria bacterium]